MNVIILASICVSAQFVAVSSFAACKEPDLCRCMAGCQIFGSNQGIAGRYQCEKPFLVLPNLGIFWGPRIIDQQVTWAKEKLAFEASKSYDAPWKDHVLGGKKAGVAGMYGLLGITINAMKARYSSHIQSRVLEVGAVGQCDLAKCIAFCKNTCESMCAELESTDDSFLASISWTKDMCDIEGAKTKMKTECENVRDAIPKVAQDKGFASVPQACDANCDSAPVVGSLTGFVLIVIRLAALIEEKI